MKDFAETYHRYIDAAQQAPDGFGFDIHRIAQLEPLLGFMYETWWRVGMEGLERLPQSGPALIIGNAGGVIPWPALMLLYALMKGPNPRRLNILADLDWVEDERIYSALTEVGFVAWSANNAKRLFAQGELVAMFPEGTPGLVKPFSERNRLRPFDWARFLPAVEEKVPVFPLATLGCDASVPVLCELPRLAKFLGLPAFPVTPFFPWLPFPASLMTVPVKWNMRLMKQYTVQVGPDEDREQASRRIAAFLEGEIQADVNRLIRARIKPLF